MACADRLRDDLAKDNNAERGRDDRDEGVEGSEQAVEQEGEYLKP